jgi:DUF971 family protein
MNDLLPLDVKRDGDGLKFHWSDGSIRCVSFAELRKACPCATCNEERKRPPNPFKVLSAREVAAGAPRPTAMKPIGRYAYQLVWNDGHDTGIYPLPLLYELGTPQEG